MVSTATKLLKEEAGGVMVVDLYNKREALVIHMTSAAQQAKMINEGTQTDSENNLLKVALKGISNSIMELLVLIAKESQMNLNCQKCQKKITEDSILCEGPDSCNRWFHRECAGLHPGSFFHTGWLCGVSPCLGKLKESERIEDEKRRVKEQALQQRLKETKEIQEQKRKWEEEKRQKEEEARRQAEAKAEKERQEKLARIRQVDEESARLEEELKKQEEEMVATTGMTLSQRKEISKWQKAHGVEPALLDIPKEIKEGALNSPKRPLSQNQTPAQTQSQPQSQQAPSQSEEEGAVVRRSPLIPKLEAVRMSSLLDEYDDVKEICKVRAIHDYDPIGGDGQDLTFKTGDVISVIKKQKDGWWEGVLNGNVGFFYKSFVEEISDNLSSPTSNLVITNAPAVKKKAGGIGFEAPCPKIAVEELQEPDFEGWLWKVGGNSKNWKKRWFVLKDFCLYYFEANKSGNYALGMVLIPGYTITAYQDPKRENCMMCDHPSARTYYFSAESKQDQTLWIDTLNRAAKAKTWNEKVEDDPSSGSKRKDLPLDNLKIPRTNSKESASSSTPTSLQPLQLQPQQQGSTRLKFEDTSNSFSNPDLTTTATTTSNQEPDSSGGSTRKDPPPKPTKPPKAPPNATPVVVSENVVGSGNNSPNAAAVNSGSTNNLASSLSGSSLTLASNIEHGSQRNNKGNNMKVPVPNISVKDLKNAELQGWLFKQGFNNKNWKKRWCVLEGFCLYYFESNKNDSKALGMVLLPSYTISEIFSKDSKNHCFEAYHPSARCYSFSAESEESAKDWVEKLLAVATMS